VSAAVHPLRIKILRIGSTAVVASVLLGSCIGMFVLGLGPLTGRYRVLTVLSGSMRPTLPVGSIVVVTPQPLDDIRVGDIITFQEPGDRLVLETHRVVRILRDGPVPVVVTKGDDNARPDPWRRGEERAGTSALPESARRELGGIRAPLAVAFAQSRACRCRGPRDRFSPPAGARRAIALEAPMSRNSSICNLLVAG